MSFILNVSSRFKSDLNLTRIYWKIGKYRYPVLKAICLFQYIQNIFNIFNIFLFFLFSITKCRLYLIYHQDLKVILIKHIYCWKYRYPFLKAIFLFLFHIFRNLSSFLFYFLCQG